MTTSRKSDLRLRGLGLLLVCLAVSSIARPVVSAEERNVDKREALKEPTYTLEDMLSEALQPNFELNLGLISALSLFFPPHSCPPLSVRDTLQTDSATPLA